MDYNQLVKIKIIYDQSGANPTGAISRIRITASGVGYTYFPQAFVGGEVFIQKQLHLILQSEKQSHLEVQQVD